MKQNKAEAVKAAIHPYREDQFDAGYYGGGARGGFPTYRYDTPEQRQELEYKWDYCQMGGDFRSILFVGCALGFEVKYFRSRGKSAFGVDISHYALEHSEQEAKPFVSLYNGWDLSRQPECDAIAAFDVLTLVPSGLIEKLSESIVAKARSKIVVRTITKNFRNWHEEWDGQDGVSFRYLPFHEWDRLFSESGKFRFFEGHVWHHYQGIYVWKTRQ